MKQKYQYPLRLCLVSLCLALFMSQLFTLPAFAQAPTLRFEHISVREGLAQSTIYAILQDRQGFLWIGTEGGLHRYDGYNFLIYKHDPDLPSTLADNVIWALYEDQAGDLWIGTGRGLDRLNREAGTFEHFAYDPSLPAGLNGTVVQAIVQDQAGALWAGTNDGGLNRLDPASGRFTHYRYDPTVSNSLSSDGVKALFVDQSGNLWVGTNRGLDRFDPKQEGFIHYALNKVQNSDQENPKVLTIYQDQAGSLWVGTEDAGLFQFDPATETWVNYSSNPEDDHSLNNNSVWALLEDQEGRLWVGTDGGGLSYLDREQKKFIVYRHDPNNLFSLSRDSVISLYEDRSGVFWVGTYGGGLNKSNHNTVKFNLYQQETNQGNNLSDNSIWSIYEDPSGALWLGTMQGGLNRMDRKDGNVLLYQHDPNRPDSLSSNNVRSLLPDGQGKLWVGTADRGLNLFDPRTGTSVQFHHSPTDPTSLGSEGIRALFEDRQGTLWIGTLASGLDRFNRDKGNFDHFRHDPNNPNSLIDDRVRAIYQDRQEALWIGTWGGISLFDPATEQFTNFVSSPGDPTSLSHAAAFAFYEDPDGFLWIATYGGGLNRFNRKSGTFTHYTEADGLAHNQVYAILPDANGFLWLSTNNGLSRFDPGTGTFRNFGIQDGLQSTEFNLGAAFKSSSGEMFFGGVEGLNAFYPEMVKDHSYIPPVIITAFQRFNQTVKSVLTPGETISLSYKDNFFSFEFTALDFTAPEKNQYAYQLEGFDPDWVYAGTRRYASYTNLDGGNYVFKVRGTNSDGVWNEAGVAIPITISPPFWRNWWFTAIVAGGLIGVIAGVFALRSRNYKIQKEKLENMILVRTAEIERRRQVAESLRDTLTILNSNRPLNTILTFLAGQTVRLLACDGIAIYRLEPGKDRLTIHASHGLDPKTQEDGMSLPLGQGITGQAVVRRETMAVEDTLNLVSHQNQLEEERERNLLEYMQHQYRAVLSTPLLIQGEIFGALTLYYQEPRSFSHEEIELAVMVAGQAILAIETARLRDQAGDQAVTAERTRLARDLHDAVTQTLFSSSLIAEVLPRIWERNPEEGRRRLEELRQLNRGALAEMRTLLLELRPSSLLEADLSELFRHLADAFTGRTRVPVCLKVDDAAESGKSLPSEVKVALYRVAQEALNNVTKHAHARQVELEVYSDPEGTQLSITDDGQGFDPYAVPPDHLGLGIMHERAENIGARLEVNSRPGEGTRIKVTWKSESGTPV